MVGKLPIHQRTGLVFLAGICCRTVINAKFRCFEDVLPWSSHRPSRSRPDGRKRANVEGTIKRLCTIVFAATPYLSCCRPCAYPPFRQSRWYHLASSLLSSCQSNASVTNIDCVLRVRKSDIRILEGNRVSKSNTKAVAAGRMPTEFLGMICPQIPALIELCTASSHGLKTDILGWLGYISSHSCRGQVIQPAIHIFRVRSGPRDQRDRYVAEPLTCTGFLDKDADAHAL